MSTESSSADAPIKLTRARDWPEWFYKYRSMAKGKGVWDILDPDAPDSEHLPDHPPTPVTYEEAEEITLVKMKELWNKVTTVLEALPPPSSPNVPDVRPPVPEIPKNPSLIDVERQYNRLSHKHVEKTRKWEKRVVGYDQMTDWVNDTVSTLIMKPIHARLGIDDTIPLQRVVREIRRQVAPTSAVLEYQARLEYQRVVRQGMEGRVNPQIWVQEWNRAFSDAIAQGMPDTDNNVNIVEFLQVAKKLSPEWGTVELLSFERAMERGGVTETLKSYGEYFASHVSNSALMVPKGNSGVFATLGGSSDSAGPQSSKAYHECPCGGPQGKAERHYWVPTECYTLKEAVTGIRRGNRSSDPAILKRVRSRLSQEQWKSLREELKRLGWKPQKQDTATRPNDRASEQSSQGKSGASKKWPGSVVAATFDPRLMEELPSAGVYAALDYGSHPLSASSLLDNCGATHVVNSKDLFEPGSMRKAPPGDRIETGTTSTPVHFRGRRIFRNLMNGPKGEGTEDLVLEDVALVEGFHTNIVSEARLRKQGVWYCGADLTLRFGKVEESVVVRKLVPKFNVVFLEYKPISSYLQIPALIPTSAGGIFMFPTLERRVRPHYRRSRDYVKPRSDDEERWHARAGHLGPEALRALVYKARNVRIHGTARIKCAHCATTHAKQVIARQPSENASPRPFWRICWDLFDFPRGYDGSNWLLLVKDEYSGKLWGFYLHEKSHGEVFAVLRQFDTWVKRQYSLSICKIKQDNDTSVIGLRGYTGYEMWTREEGIDVELSPTHTHESNGGAERAGQEVITRSIKMREGANLPPNLWPETTQAAIYLHGMSPSQTHEMRSPNEVLNLWFRQYFRWYDPAIVTKLTVDLRPDWNGIYVYGARAYPMIKNREAGKHKRDFKVLARGHIGYLVGYVASNIYRIWVPLLDRVIVTRNVTFDEDLLYTPEEEKAVGQPLKTVRYVTSAIEEKYRTFQDAGTILENVGIWEDDDMAVELREEQPRGTIEETGVELGGEARATEPVESTGSGVTLEHGKASQRPDDAPRFPTGLPSPEQTPEPESMPAAGARGNSALAQGESSVGTAQRATKLQRNESQRSMEQSAGMRNEATRSTPGATRDENTPVLSAAEKTARSAAHKRDSESKTSASKASTNTPSDGLDTTTLPRLRPRPPSQPNTAQDSSRAPRKATKTTLAEQTVRNVATSSSQSLEELEGDTIVVDVPVEKPTRRRGRGRGRPRGQYSVLEPSVGTRLEKMMSIPGHQGLEMLENFFGTFWPDQPSAVEGGENCRTVHAIIAASVLQNKVSRSVKAKSTPNIHQSELPKAPTSWASLDKHPLGDLFKADAELELNNLEARECWRVIPRDEAKTRPIPLKWVFTYKVNAAGNLIRCRSRIVVRGDLQDDDTILSTYAATLAARSFRVAMAIAARFDLEIKQFDVVNAFINARRRKANIPVACTLPDGFKIPGKCVEIDRALYGLRDSPALWFEEFSSTLLKLDLKPSKEEPCLFMNEERTVIVVFYVDDVQVLYHKKDERAAQAVIEGIKEAYELRDLGDIDWFLGMRVIRDRAARKIWLTHDTYIEKMARKFELMVGKCPSTPLPGTELRKNEGLATPKQVKEYQERVGSVLYTAIMLRPDVAFAASQLSHFLTNPSKAHLAAVNWTIRYLFATRFLAIEYSYNYNEMQLVIASDASFADDVETRRSSQGYIISLFGGLVAWKAARQSTVSTSTTQAELLGVALVAQELMALKRFFEELRLDLGEAWTIFCDNQQTIRLIVGENTRISTKLRHVDVQNMWLREEHGKGTFQVTYLPTASMPADGLTKNLPRHKFENFRALLNLQDVRGMVELLE